MFISSYVNTSSYCLENNYLNHALSPTLIVKHNNLTTLINDN
jgi:hypothetical protein